MDSLENVKPGDKLWIPSNYGPGRIETVTRVTGTQVITGTPPGEERYRKANGKKIGSNGWNTVWAYIATDHHIQKITEAHNLYRLQTYKWHETTVEQRNKILRILETPHEPNL